MSMKQLLILSLVFLILLPLRAQDSLQNWIYNPSFEDHMECPKKVDALGTLTIVDGWYQPTRGSADYYNLCGSRECGIPKNKLGIQNVRTGSGYCGIYCSKTDYREYLQTELKQPLLPNRHYRLTFYVSLSEYSPHIVATVGGLFTRERVADTVFSVLMRKETQRMGGHISQTIATYYEPQVVHRADSLLDDMVEWMPVSGVFSAQGGERFLTIGNFYPASASNYVEREGDFLLPGAYYYLDDVSLVCLDCNDTAKQPPVAPVELDPPDTTTYAVGDTLQLHEVYFDFDQSTLLQQSYKELRKVIEVLNRYPKMKIEISGHTDNRGTAEYNQHLSEDRAKAVTNYLIDHGIDGRRLSFAGYGKSRPIDTNDTDAGRARNRRVEVKILSM